MDLFSELQSTVYNDLTSGSESTLFPVDTVKLNINRAYRKAGALFRWAETEDAKKTSTVAGQEYYDYPQTWRPDSVWKLEIDGIDYGDPLLFKDYLLEKENDFPSGLEKAWSNQWRRYFVYPIPTANGSYNISIWGQKTVDKLVNDSDTTIFSYSMPECNDAVVLEAVAICKAKADQKNDGEFLSIEAKQILINAWAKIQQEQKKYEPTQPFFEVQDFFARGGQRTRTGRFD